MKKKAVVITAVLAAFMLTGCMGQIEHLVKQGQTPDMTTCSDVIKDGQTDVKQLAGLFGSPTKVTTGGAYEEREYAKGNLKIKVKLNQSGIVKTHECEIK